MLEIVQQVEEATNYISKQLVGQAEVGMILGTGLSPMAREITTDAMLDYHDIPHFPHSTVESHAGRCVCGKLAGKSVMAMEVDSISMKVIRWRKSRSLCRDEGDGLRSPDRLQCVRRHNPHYPRGRYHG